MEAIPVILFGAAALQEKPERVVIGVEIERSASPKVQSDQSTAFGVTYHLFMNPPTVALTGLGTMVVDSVTRKATLMPDEYGCFEATGEFSEDYLSLRGLATFREIQLMDVSGTFVDCPFVLNAQRDD